MRQAQQCHMPSSWLGDGPAMQIKWCESRLLNWPSVHGAATKRVMRCQDKWNSVIRTLKNRNRRGKASRVKENTHQQINSLLHRSGYERSLLKPHLCGATLGMCDSPPIKAADFNSVQGVSYHLLLPVWQFTGEYISLHLG